MTREDFSATVDSQGYMVLYRGKPLGGAGTINKPRGRYARANVTMYREDAEREIARLVAGHGQPRFLAVIAKIDEESAA